MPLQTIRAARLEQTAGVEARLADGTTAILETYSCRLEWFEDERVVEVIANEGEYPLLGVGLLCDRVLWINYPGRAVSIE